MKRRDFLRNSAAAAALPALPLPLKAASATTLAPVTYGMDPYRWAAYTARINKHLSADMLSQFLGFTSGDAQTTLTRLVSDNILNAPDATGLYTTSESYLAKFAQKRAASTLTKTLRERAQEAVDTHLSEDPEEEDPSCEKV